MCCCCRHLKSSRSCCSFSSLFANFWQCVSHSNAAARMTANTLLLRLRLWRATESLHICRQTRRNVNRLIQCAETVSVAGLRDWHLKQPVAFHPGSAVLQSQWEAESWRGHPLPPLTARELRALPAGKQVKSTGMLWWHSCYIRATRTRLPYSAPPLPADSAMSVQSSNAAVGGGRCGDALNTHTNTQIQRLHIEEEERRRSCLHDRCFLTHHHGTTDLQVTLRNAQKRSEGLKRSCFLTGQCSVHRLDHWKA